MRETPALPASIEATVDFRFWLQADMQLPENEVSFTSQSGHMQNWVQVPRRDRRIRTQLTR